MKKSLKKLTIFIVAMSIALIAVSCGGGSKENPDTGGGNNGQPNTPLSGAHQLTSFKLQASGNPGIGADVVATLAYCPYPGINLVLLTVPESFDLTNVTPSFSVSSKAKLKVAGVEATSGTTKMNLSNTLKVEVVAENSSTGTYYILARNGNAKYDNAVYKLMRVYGIPGVSIAATKNEQIVYAAGYGFADVDNLTRVDENTLFRLASVSKSQAALCIMKLYEQGLIEMDDKVFGSEGILDEYIAPFVPGADEVTVENLLYHNSGWNYHIDDQIFSSSSSPYYGLTLNQRIDYLVHHDQLQNAVGSTYSYLNMGFTILGKIIEKLTGMKYEEYLRSVVAEAGVTDMWIGGSTKAERRGNETVYYAQNGRTAYGNDMPNVVGACGAIIASPSDLMKILCHEDYGTVLPDILQEETLDLLYTPSSNYDRIAHGWRVNNAHWNKWASYHGGNLNGTANLWVRGKQGCNAVILTNSRSYGIEDENGNDNDDQLYVILGTILGDLGN